MNLWLWAVLGGGLLALSATVALGVAAVLGSLSREVSRLVETESWLPVSPARPTTKVADL